MPVLISALRQTSPEQVTVCLEGGREIRVYRDLDSRYLLGDFYAKLHLLFPREG